MMRKKRISEIVITFIFVIFTCGFYGDEVKADETWGDWEYNDYGSGVEIAKYLGSDSRVVIPSEINGKKVVSIGDFAFDDYEIMTGIEIPDSVTNIDDAAFQRCINLTDIKIPSGVNNIGRYAFYDCRSLKNIVLPDGITYISRGIFCYCENLSSIEIPNNVTSIGEDAFFECTNLISVEIPNSVTYIGEDAFSWCSSLTSIDIPDGVTRIKDFEFSGCESLKSIEISDNVISIGENAFNKCSSLNTLYTLKGSYAEEFFKENLPNVKILYKSSYVENTDYNTSTEPVVSISKRASLLGKSCYKDYLESIVSLKAVIPGIKQTNQGNKQVCHDMVPQGICTTNEYILISAYCHENKHKPVIYVMDKRSCKYKTTILLSVENNEGLKIKNAHVGGLAFYNDYVYIAGSSDNKVWKLPYSEVTQAVNSNSDVYDAIIKSGDCFSSNKASFLFWDNSYQNFFVGTFNKNNANKNYMFAYDKNGNNFSTKLQLPLHAQGASIAVYKGKTYLICSCSLGQNNKSAIYIAELKKPQNACGYILSNWRKIDVPNMSEDLQVEGGIIYNCFESAANPYNKGGLKDTALDRIPFISVNSLISAVLKHGDSVSINNSPTGYASLAGALPVGAENDTYDEIAKNKNDIVSSGTCGDNINYCLYDDGTMLISGQGDMDDFAADSAPWESYKNSINSVFIDMGVTSVGEYAFYNCKSLSEVTLSEFMNSNVKFTIRNNAFGNCIKLNSVSLPETSYTISDNAFMGDSNVLLKSNSNDISKFAASKDNCKLHTHKYSYKGKVEASCMENGYDIYRCSCGKEVVDNVVEATGNHKFIEVSRENATKNSEGFILYSCQNCLTSHVEVLEYSGGDDATNVPTKKSTQTTEKSIEKKTDTITTAPKKGTKHVLSSGTYKVTSSTSKKKEVTFVKPKNKKVKSVKIPKTVKIKGYTYKVTSIAANAFKGCKKLQKVTIGKNVKSIGKKAFSGCTKLSKVTIGTNVTTIGLSAFEKCTSLKSIAIPKKVKKIGKKAFYGCKKLKTINIKTTKLKAKTVGAKAFGNIYKKPTVKLQKKSKKAYKKWIFKKGLTKKAKIK